MKQQYNKYKTNIITIVSLFVVLVLFVKGLIDDLCMQILQKHRNSKEDKSRKPSKPLHMDVDDNRTV